MLASIEPTFKREALQYWAAVEAAANGFSSWCHTAMKSADRMASGNKELRRFRKSGNQSTKCHLHIKFSLPKHFLISFNKLHVKCSSKYIFDSAWSWSTFQSTFDFPWSLNISIIFKPLLTAIRVVKWRGEDNQSIYVYICFWKDWWPFMPSTKEFAYRPYINFISQLKSL